MRHAGETVGVSMSEKLKRVNLQRFADEGEAGTVTETSSSDTATESLSTPETLTGGEGEIISGTYAERHKARQERMAAMKAKIDAQAAGTAVQTAETASEKPVSFGDRMKALKAEDPKAFQEYFDAQFGSRHKDYKTMQESSAKLRPVLDLLKAQYGTDEPEALLNGLKRSAAMSEQWQDLADSNGMTADQYLDKVLADAERDRVKAENEALRASVDQRAAGEDIQRRVNELASEADALSEKYPSFDLAAELENTEFQRYLKMGNSVEDSYLLTHHDTIENIAQAAAEKKVLENIRSRGNRPAEAGMRYAGRAGQVKSDPTQMTRAERRKLAERAMRGETVKF